MTGTEMQTHIKAADFNAEKDYLYTKPKLNQQGGKSIGILNSKTNSSLLLETPLMRCWGINENDYEGKGTVKYDMSLQFPDKEYRSEEMQKFLDNMLALEEKVKADAIKNSKEWMNKPKLSQEVVDALWTPMVRYGKDPNTGEPDRTKNPTLNIKIPVWDGEWKVDLYNPDSEQLFPNDKGVTVQELITKPTDVATVIQCGGIWFANGKFGVTWKLVQAVVKPKQSLRGKCLISLSAEDKATLANAKYDEEDDNDAGAEVVAVEDSSDEEEAEPEPETTPVKEEVKQAVAEAVAPSAPKKKVVRRKKVAEE